MLDRAVWIQRYNKPPKLHQYGFFFLLLTMLFCQFLSSHDASSLICSAAVKLNCKQTGGVLPHADRSADRSTMPRNGGVGINLV
ncbi:hypothetical protein N5P37_008612 [Trichoderma harzianum]|nr:hypothetical protein N5P37_008612 [Trichoderma harzianum]